MCCKECNIRYRSCWVWQVEKVPYLFQDMFLAAEVSKCGTLQPQLPANRDIVHLSIPQPNLAGAGSALGRRLQDAAGEV